MNTRIISNKCGCGGNNNKCTKAIFSMKNLLSSSLKWSVKITKSQGTYVCFVILINK
jgi:hypothetical protein